MEVGFLGLGIMGKAMATDLLRHGFRVTVRNQAIAKVRLRPAAASPVRSKSITSNPLRSNPSMPSHVHATPSPFRAHAFSAPSRFCPQCQELVALGTTVGETPASVVVAKCNYTIAMLSDPAAALSAKTRCIWSLSLSLPLSLSLLNQWGKMLLLLK
jgi:glyoxylate/succinic semialdehyde reductase